MAILQDIAANIDAATKAQNEFQESVKAVLDAQGDRIEELEARSKSPGKTGTERKAPPTYGTLFTDAGEKGYVVGSKARLSDVPALRGEPEVSLARWLNATAFGEKCEDREAIEWAAEKKSVTTGSTGALVPTEYVSDWLDMARAQSVLIAAGTQTVTMPSKSMTWSHQTADPTASWQGSEGAALSASDPTFAARTLTAKTVAVRTQVSLEASMDIPSFGEQITRAYSAALGAAIDQAGIQGSATVTGLQGVSGVGAVTSVGTPTNYDEIVDGVRVFLNANNMLGDLTGIIMHPNVWSVYQKLKTGISSDNTPLTLPPAIANTPMFVTTGADDSSNSPEDYHVLLGNFRDLILGMRMNPSIRILDGTTNFASNLLIEVVGVARVDFLATRPASFVRLEDVTTS